MGMVSRSSMEMAAEWPEVVNLASKLIRGEELSEGDRAWLGELVKEVGWDADVVVEELKSVDLGPLTRVVWEVLSRGPKACR